MARTTTSVRCCASGQPSATPCDCPTWELGDWTGAIRLKGLWGDEASDRAVAVADEREARGQVARVVSAGMNYGKADEENRRLDRAAAVRLRGS